MPNTIPDHYQTEFATNFDHGVQQKMSRLKETVQTDTIKGKEKRYNRLEASEWRPITVRKGVTTPQAEETALRWVRLLGYDNCHWKDEFDDDLLGDIVLPNSELMQNHVMGYGRLLDRVTLEAALGTAYTGAAGTTATILPTSTDTNVVAVDYVESGSAANSGLTVAKLRRAKYLLDNNLDPEDESGEVRTIAVRAKQLDDLLRTTEVTSADFNTVKALVDGKIDTFLGFKFKRTKQVSVSSGDIAECVAYTRSSMRVVNGRNKSKLSILDTQNESIQARSACLLGAVRYWEEGVIKVRCDQSP